MRVISVFSGGGLGDYGLELSGMEIVGQVEIDEYCQKILKLRWPKVPKWKDIREVKGSDVLEAVGRIDLISGGPPCQPFSTAGKQRGKEDNRNLWPEMFRFISEIEPSWVFVENVRGIVKIYLDTILSDLESIGYSTIPILVSAQALGAPHKRERLWIVAHSGGRRFGKQNFCGQQLGGTKTFGSSEIMANTNSVTTQRKWSKQNHAESFGLFGGETRRQTDFWLVEPNVGRVAHGVANRVDRLKLLGNGQVVQVVQWIGERIMENDSNII